MGVPTPHVKSGGRRAYEGFALRLPNSCDLCQRTASDGSSSDEGSVGSSDCTGGHKGAQRRQSRLQTVVMVAGTAMCLSVMAYWLSDGAITERLPTLPTMWPGRNGMGACRRMRAGRLCDPPRMMRLVRPSAEAFEAAEAAKEYSAWVRESEWNATWNSWTEEQQQAWTEEQAILAAEREAEWQRKQDALTAEEQAAERKRWEDEWNAKTPEEQRQITVEKALEWQRYWDSLTPEEQEQQRQQWDVEWRVTWDNYTYEEQAERRAKWSPDWHQLTPAEQQMISEKAALEWRRQWDTLTPEQQKAQRRKWDEEWKRWDSLTPEQQEAQRTWDDEKKWDVAKRIVKRSAQWRQFLDGFTAEQKQEWDSLTPAQQEAQHRRWNEEWKRLQAEQTSSVVAVAGQQ